LAGSRVIHLTDWNNLLFQIWLADGPGLRPTEFSNHRISTPARS
jgi:hypothetical protein